MDSPRPRFDRVILESPFAGATQELFDTYQIYLKRAILDCLRRREAPFASHAIYSQVLDDATPAERETGLHAGWAWMGGAHRVIVYSDYGISGGMDGGIRRADEEGLDIEYREIGLNPDAG
jgi:hypothetical protein